MGPPADQIVATDLADPSQGALFEGDSSEDYQYDIYRYMRGALYFDAPLTEDVHALSAAELWERTGRSWEQFHPQTNLVWLHFVLWMLLEQLEWPSEKVRGKKRGKGRKKKTVVEEVSAEEVRRLEREVELEGVLLKVQDLLDPNAMCANGIRSASDLVGFAVGEGWLDVEDVVGEGVEESALISQLEGLEI
jgi:serine/threonine-protein kinase haspin